MRNNHGISENSQLCNEKTQVNDKPKRSVKFLPRSISISVSFLCSPKTFQLQFFLQIFAKETIKTRSPVQTILTTLFTINVVLFTINGDN